MRIPHAQFFLCNFPFPVKQFSVAMAKVKQHHYRKCVAIATRQRHARRHVIMVRFYSSKGMEFLLVHQNHAVIWEKLVKRNINESERLLNGRQASQRLVKGVLWVCYAIAMT